MKLNLLTEMAQVKNSAGGAVMLFSRSDFVCGEGENPFLRTVNAASALNWDYQCSLSGLCLYTRRLLSQPHIILHFFITSTQRCLTFQQKTGLNCIKGGTVRWVYPKLIDSIDLLFEHYFQLSVLSAHLPLQLQIQLLLLQKLLMQNIYQYR